MLCIERDFLIRAYFKTFANFGSSGVASSKTNALHLNGLTFAAPGVLL